jgi:hypothetical protein
VSEKTINGCNLPVSDRLNRYNSLSLLGDMSNDMDALFLLIFWYNYDSNEFLILPTEMPFTLCELRNYRKSFSVISSIIRNFLEFIIIKLTSTTCEIDRQAFLKYAEQLYNYRFFGLINYCINLTLRMDERIIRNWTKV